MKLAIFLIALSLWQSAAYAKKKPEKQPIPIYQGVLEDIKVGEELVGFRTVANSETTGQALTSTSVLLDTTSSAVSRGVVRYYRWYAILSGGLLLIGRERIHPFFRRSRINAGDFIAGQIVDFGWDRFKGKIYLPGMKHNHPLTVHEQRMIPGLPNPLGIRVSQQQIEKAVQWQKEHPNSKWYNEH